MKKKHLWIGLAEIEPISRDNILGEFEVAFVNVLGHASSENEFRDYVEEFFLKKNLRLIEIEEPELFSNRVQNYIIDNVLRDLANESWTSKEIKTGTFHIVKKK